MAIVFTQRDTYMPGDLKFGAELNGVQMHVYFVSSANKWNVAAWLERSRQPHPCGGRHGEAKDQASAEQMAREFARDIIEKEIVWLMNLREELKS